MTDSSGAPGRPNSAAGPSLGVITRSLSGRWSVTSDVVVYASGGPIVLGLSYVATAVNVIDRAAAVWGVPAATVAASPAVLVGQVAECADRLVERRERYGFSYIHVGTDIDNAGPLVARLEGR